MVEMTENHYKIVLWGNDLYREYELSDKSENVIKVGTDKGCQVRFSEDAFFEKFSFRIEKTESSWQLVSDGNVYFTDDDIMKVYSKDLKHGDEVAVKYRNLGGKLFTVDFFIDFDSGVKKYNDAIDISGRREVTIGGEGCDINIHDELLGKGSIRFSFENGTLVLQEDNSKYGVYLNGIKVALATKINEYDFFSIVGYSFYLKNGTIYTEKSEKLKVNNLTCYTANKQESSYTYPKFNRGTRIFYPVSDKQIEILPPSSKPTPPKSNLVTSLLPIVLMLGVTVVLRGTMGGSGMFIVYSAATISIGGLVSVIGIVSEKRNFKKEKLLRKQKYHDYIKEKEEQIKVARSDELELLQKTFIPIEECIESVMQFKKELFERRPDDVDFLKVRLGTGKVEAQRKITISENNNSIDPGDELFKIPEQIQNKYRFLTDAPVVANFYDAGGVGFVGSHFHLYNMLKNCTLDICVHHFYREVKLFYILKQEDCDSAYWLKWLPHVKNDDLDIRNIVYDEESKKVLFEYLYILLSKRDSQAKQDKSNVISPHYLIFVFDKNGISRHPITRYIEKSSRLGVTFVFFEESEDMLPNGCSTIVRLKNNGDIGTLLKSDNGGHITELSYKPVTDKDAENVAIKLAPVYVDEVSLDSELTKNITLYELLGILSAEDLDITKRWAKSKVYKSMAAPLGVKSKNEVVLLDINEKHHGPHGLVAGTTGSGKSEILQSYILSMATLFHPYDIGFVIIDFKGGGMANQFKNLPHLIGTITNIDGHEIDRSLLSIKAELRKRQELFAQIGVNHIDGYIRKFKEGQAPCPLPHLILIVDEFAELKSDYPEFMKELVSAARIGRSLGVHLILATQKPSGVVDDQIWSNSKFKLCLKVQNKEDSNEVLKSPLAAEIKEPGRAYFQVGNNEIFELFQSAYSGASASTEDLGNKKEFTISEVSLWGSKKPVFRQERSKGKGGALTQLEALVEYIADYCEKQGIKKLDGICLPPLPDCLRFSESTQPERRETDTTLAIGLYDDPANQYQGQVILNLTQSHTVIIGSSQMGKTVLLQTIIRGLAERYQPTEINFYLLDFGSMILRNFDSLNHVGGVVTASDDEKLKNFLKMMLGEIDARKQFLSEKGISSFRAYREAGHHEFPQIVVMIDNFTAFRELFSDYESDLLILCRDGIAAGISLVVTSQQTSGISYRFLSNFANRIAFSCNETSEYGNLFDKCHIQPKNVPGRGLVNMNKTVYEFQAYLGFDGEREIERVQDMKEFIARINAENTGSMAKLIPEVPKVLSNEYINVHYDSKILRKYRIPVGICYDNVSLVNIDLLALGSFMITGREKSGRTNFIKIIADYINKNILDIPIKAWIVDGANRHLSFMKNYGFVEKYTMDVNETDTIFKEIESEILRRNSVMLEDGTEALDEEPLLLCVLQNSDAVSTISSNEQTMELYKKIVKANKALKYCIIFSDIEDEDVSFGSPEILKLLKENRKAVIFNDIIDHKFMDISLATMKAYKKPIQLGDAYLMINNKLSKIKTIFE